MAAATITNKKVYRVPKDLDRALITGTAGGAGTVTIAHGLGGVPKHAHIQPIAAAGVASVTANLTTLDATNIVFEVSAACDFCVEVLSDGPWIQTG